MLKYINDERSHEQSHERKIKYIVLTAKFLKYDKIETEPTWKPLTLQFNLSVVKVKSL